MIEIAINIRNGYILHSTINELRDHVSAYQGNGYGITVFVNLAFLSRETGILLTCQANGSDVSLAAYMSSHSSYHL